jgi:hypothetical protein
VAFKATRVHCIENLTNQNYYNGWSMAVRCHFDNHCQRLIWQMATIWAFACGRLTVIVISVRSKGSYGLPKAPTGVLFASSRTNMGINDMTEGLDCNGLRFGEVIWQPIFLWEWHFSCASSIYIDILNDENYINSLYFIYFFLLLW